MAIDQTSLSEPEFWAIKLHAQEGTYKVLIEHPANASTGRLVDAKVITAASSEDEDFDLGAYLNGSVGQAVILYTAAREPVLTFEQLTRLQKQPLFWSMPGHASTAAFGEPTIERAGDISAMGYYPERPGGDYLPGLGLDLRSAIAQHQAHFPRVKLVPPLPRFIRPLVALVAERRLSREIRAARRRRAWRVVRDLLRDPALEIAQYSLAAVCFACAVYLLVTQAVLVAVEFAGTMILLGSVAFVALSLLFEHVRLPEENDDIK